SRRPDIENAPSGRYLIAGYLLVICISSEAVCNHYIHWQHKGEPLLLCLLDQLACYIYLALFEERITDLVAFSLEKSIRHAAANENAISYANKPLQHSDLVGNFGTPNDSSKGPSRILKRRTQEIDFLLHQEACHAW